jgi:hypothetical protein
MHAAYSPTVYNYHEHLVDTKEEFDEKDLSDATFYVNRERTEELMKLIGPDSEVDPTMVRPF